jgi:outer membrane protein assembly factor BamB
MKLLNSDFLALGISAVIISTFSVLLYADFTKKIEVEGVKQIGTITFKREVAQRKYQTQVVWEEVKQSYPVYNNDSIRTSEDSEAVIHLNDGTDINVDENSMIMLSTLANSININFAHGSISANRQNVAADAAISAITIMASDTTVSIDRSNIQLSQLENRELDLTVSEGSASVKTASDAEALTVNVNEKAIISSDTREAKIVPLKFDLRGPDNNRFIITESGSTTVKFDWAFSDKPAGDVNLQISSDRGFGEINQSKRITGLTGTTAQLGPGVYYWRLSAINKSSGKTEYSEIRKINIIYTAPVKHLAPLPGESVVYSLSNNSINFSWSENEMASGYILEVSDSSDFSSILKSADTALRRIALENIEPGEYFWRIKSRINAGGTETEKLSAPTKFSVERKAEFSRPKLIRPAEGDKIDRIVFRGKGAILSWNSEPGFASFDVDLASDNEFKQIIFSENRNVNFAEIRRELPLGKYYWRVKGIPAADGAPVISGPASFEVVSDISIELVSPVAGNGIEIPADTKEADLRFAWKKPEVEGSYRVQVSRKADFSEPVNSSVVDSGAVNMKLKDPGNYYWRVQLLDRDNKEIAVSRPGEFILKEPVPEKLKSFIAVKSPVSGSRIYIDSRLRGRNSLTYEVKPDTEILITIRAPGFKEHNQRVRVPAGETVSISPALDKTDLLKRVKWSYSAASPLGADPVFYKDRIVAAYENGVIAVLSGNGNLIMSAKLAKRFESRPVISGDTAYIVDVDGILYSYDLKTGKVNWNIQTLGPLLFKSEPVIADERIYFATGFGAVEAYNFKGEKIWQNMLDESVFSSVQVYRDVLLVATDALKIYALRTKDGKRKWYERIDGRVITGSPLVHNDNLYFGTQAGSFYAFTVSKGKNLWKFQADGPVYSSPVVIKDKIYFGSENGVFYALSVDSGEPVWSFKTRTGIKGSPLSAFNNIMVSDENSVYSLNPENGAVRWSASFQSTIKTSPVFAGDVVVMGLSNGEVVSVRNNLIQTVR